MMKGMLLLVLMAALAAFSDSSAIKPTSRANLNVGYVLTGDRMLYSTYVYQPAKPNTVQYQDVIFRGNITTRITAVRASEVGYTQYASPGIIAGGLGWNNVTIRVTSARGYGYYYQRPQYACQDVFSQVPKTSCQLAFPYLIC